MADIHKMNEHHGAAACHFITLNVVDWVDVFIRPVYKQIIVHSLNHFSENKGLNIYAWCLMTNHLHMIVSAGEGHSLPDIKKELKRFTTQKILEDISVEPPKRLKWMMERFENFTSTLGLIKKFQLWQTCTNPIFINQHKPEQLIEQIEYIHENPVRDRIVTTAEDYLYSSARDYAGMKGLVNIVKLPTVVQVFSALENVNGNFFRKYTRN
jgi:putative transposase